MIKDKSIFIKNIYYMLSYAFTTLNQGGYEDVATEEFENIHNLFAAILAKGISRQLKEGLYWGLDMGQVESWASMSNSNSAVNSSYAVIVKVKDGYAQDAAALLQTGYEQILSYSRMYNMDLQKVLQARLFVNGNYVALLILGAQGDWEASDEVQAKFAAEEAAKVDEVWRGIFGSADNGITIPEEDDSNNNGGFFDMTDDEGNNDPVLGG